MFKTTFALILISASVLGWALPQWTIDFDTLTHPNTGVGPAVRVFQEAGPGGFTLLRIPVDGDPSTLGNHFHTVAGNGSFGHPYQTAAEFFSDDGAPFLYFLGNYTGDSASNYAPDWNSARPFSLKSFKVLSVDGIYQLTASNGAKLTIDHAGTYSGFQVAGFAHIMWYRHDYISADFGSMIVDDIKVEASSISIGPPHNIKP